MPTGQVGKGQTWRFVRAVAHSREVMGKFIYSIEFFTGLPNVKGFTHQSWWWLIGSQSMLSLFQQRMLVQQKLKPSFSSATLSSIGGYQWNIVSDRERRKKATPPKIPLTSTPIYDLFLTSHLHFILIRAHRSKRFFTPAAFQ